MPQPLHNWIPYQIAKIENECLQCKWLNTFNLPYLEPFFDETISQCRYADPNIGKYSSVSDITVLEQWAAGLNCLTPDVIIFHVSRCGSTMVSQLMGLNPANISLAEVPFFDDILRLPYRNKDLDKSSAIALLNAAFKFYGQKRTGVYPDVPFVFLYRSPNEVLSSHKKRHGMQTVPGLLDAELFGLNTADVTDLDVSSNELSLMEERSRYHSKYPDMKFAEELNLVVDSRLEDLMSLYRMLANGVAPDKFFKSAVYPDNFCTSAQPPYVFHSVRPRKSQIFTQRFSVRITVNYFNIN
eukprot:gene7419-7483_t